MTPGDNGASTPEEDDPFGYLYADGQARGAQPPSGGYGYPNAVSRVRAVGERQYPQQQTYGQQVPPQQAAYGQQTVQTPQAAPGAAPTGSRSQQNAGRRGPNTNVLLIAAIAVVAVVIIGISVAMFNGDSGDDADGGASAVPTQSQTSKPSPSSSDKAAGGLPKTDAKSLSLEGGAVLASDVKGAKSDGGVYVNGFNHIGAKISWTVSGIEKAGDVRLYARYSVPGTDANATVSVNGKANSQPIGFKNFIGSPKGDYEKGWQSTWAPVTLNKGTNVIEIACNDGNQCDALVDQLWLQ
ncbi:carbohydrate-binding protein [Streptomyces sp. NPDC059597]|uniref:carbohydrate-binding protein n=1 Tax=Streptomyces sp. NPDC059597 TaxID=3346879 RepID=UPI00368F034D